MISLPVPYKSEFDEDANLSNANCGEASVAMVLGLYGKQISTNEIFTLAGSPQGFTTIQQLQGAVEQLGFTFYCEPNSSTDKLKQTLDKGQPVIVLVHAGSLTSRQDKNFSGGHFMVVVGYRDDGYLVNDPDFWGNFRQDGDHHFYTTQEFEEAWSSCHINSNPDNVLIRIRGITSIDTNASNQQQSEAAIRDVNTKIDSLYNSFQDSLHRISNLEGQITILTTRINSLVEAKPVPDVSTLVSASIPHSDIFKKPAGQDSSQNIQPSQQQKKGFFASIFSFLSTNGGDGQ